MSHDASNSPACIEDVENTSISPEMNVFHQLNNNERLMYHQTSTSPDLIQQTMPSQNVKKSFCIEALLKKDQENSNGSDSENNRTFNHFVNNNNYKENIISREFDRSPSDDQMSRFVDDFYSYFKNRR